METEELQRTYPDRHWVKAAQRVLAFLVIGNLESRAKSRTTGRQGSGGKKCS
jgi:hypothetical protein